MRHAPSVAERLLIVSAALVCAASPGVEARERVAVTGLVDAEAWDTQSGSLLLERGKGEPSTLARLRLWAGADILPGLQGFALGQIETGRAYEDGKTEVGLDNLFLRYYVPGRARLMIDAGKIAVPFGNFSGRYLSRVNPLIGSPDGYGVSYPTGVSLLGRVGKFDWKVAALDRPLANENYVPGSDAAWRPGASLAFTPAIGIRFAAYWTQGPYLGAGVEPMLPAGGDWHDPEQVIEGLEFTISRGYFELNGDVVFSSYDVPTTTERARGQAWFLEPKYTWTPHLFTALRLERNDYPFILPISPFYWIASNAEFYDVEVGAGWRFTPDLILKASYREDHWNVDAANEAFFPNGRAFALQLSYGFDVNSWFRRPQ